MVSLNSKEVIEKNKKHILSWYKGAGGKQAFVDDFEWQMGVAKRGKRSSRQAEDYAIKVILDQVGWYNLKKRHPTKKAIELSPQTYAASYLNSLGGRKYDDWSDNVVEIYDKLMIRDGKRLYHDLIK